MAKDKQAPPPRKEPGFIGRTFGVIIGTIFWLVISLLMSVLIEWIGIAMFWPEEGRWHSQRELQKDYAYLDERVIVGMDSFARYVTSKANVMIDIVEDGAWLSDLRQLAVVSQEQSASKTTGTLRALYIRFEEYLLAIPNVVQMFIVRLAILILSAPSFLMFAMIGVVDGLVQRDLRRWGGGRESSVVYNIARKSVLPLFVLACVVYLSLPVSVHPALVVIPFAVFVGGAVRVAMERFKKYF